MRSFIWTTKAAYHPRKGSVAVSWNVVGQAIEEEPAGQIASKNIT
ncbi:hypothetical protein BN1184_AD_00470 [Pantoea ananatis]|nr:hypothetical protein BN1184_AD_00470 [Pantoea ananatis]